MRPVPLTHACFSAVMAAAAAAVIAPALRLPAPPAGTALDAAMARPSATAGQPALAAPSPHRATAARVSDDLDSSRLLPTASPAPSLRALQARSAPVSPPSPAAPASYPSYAPLPSQSAAYAPAPAQSAATGGESAFQACVIARESGGSPQVMNASGHYGLYQFDYGTWVSGGGSPADFGHASVSEQNSVFASVYAARGASPWAPYDGC